MTFQTHQFPYGDDNYGLLMHCTESGLTACVDAGDASATEAALAETGWRLSHIFITHHHSDHTAGLNNLKERHDVSVCLLYTSPSPRDISGSRMPSSA